MSRNDEIIQNLNRIKDYMDESAKDFPNCAKEARSALKKVKELAAEYENENQGLRDEIKKLKSPAEFHGSKHENEIDQDFDDRDTGFDNHDIDPNYNGEYSNYEPPEEDEE